MNAALNNTRIDTLSDNLLEPRNSQIAQDVILAGDVCYENDLAGHVLEWLEELTGIN
jgi:predicted nicotinamide N-methyase